MAETCLPLKTKQKRRRCSLQPRANIFIASSAYSISVRAKFGLKFKQSQSSMRRSGIRWQPTTTQPIEEFATAILQELHPDRLNYCFNSCQRPCLLP